MWSRSWLFSKKVHVQRGEWKKGKGFSFPYISSYHVYFVQPKIIIMQCKGVESKSLHFSCIMWKTGGYCDWFYDEWWYLFFVSIVFWWLFYQVYKNSFFCLKEIELFWYFKYDILLQFRSQFTFFTPKVLIIKFFNFFFYHKISTLLACVRIFFEAFSFSFILLLLLGFFLKIFKVFRHVSLFNIMLYHRFLGKKN